MAIDSKKIEKVQNELLKNPKYSSDKISILADLTTNYEYFYSTKTIINDVSLEDFNESQLEVIKSAAKYFADNNIHVPTNIEYIADPKLNATQMQLKFIAVQNNVPYDIINKIIDPDIPYASSKYVLDAYIDGYDITDYIHYDPEQIFEISAACYTGIDYHEFADTDITAETMGLIRHAMSLGFTCDYDYGTGDIALFKLKK